MSGYDVSAWLEFFVAETGAAAALTGLVIVAISINIGTILKYPHLPPRAAESIALLTGVLILSTLGMVPGQSVMAVGVEIVAVGVIMWAITTAIQLRTFRKHYVYPRRWVAFMLGQAAALPIVAAGVSFLAGFGGGLYWMVPGIIFAVLGGIINTWVLLVEILR